MKEIKAFKYRVLLIGLMILGFKNVQAQTSQFEVFSSSTERINVTFMTNVSYVTAGKKIIFTVHAGVKDSNYKIQTNSISLNIYNMNTSANETRLAFVNSEKENEYSTGYTFSKSGKYKFSLVMNIVDYSNNVKTEEMSFSREVLKNESMQNEKSGNGFMGMGTTMMIVAGAVMMVVMTLVIMGGHR